MENFLDFLDNKPLYYDEIDLTRMPKAFESIKEHLNTNAKIIHLVGTNAKGTTGRFLATALKNSGFSVAHYTSPHIMNFNERIWINGEIVTNEALQKAHEVIYNLLGVELSDSLSYFEYTTFLAIKLSLECDYIVLEAGLGGEFDATNVFEKELSLFTPIDFDHQSFLGEDITQIAQTKMRSMQKRALLGYQKHTIVKEVFQEIATAKSYESYFLEELITQSDKIYLQEVAERLKLADYMLDNISLALGALKLLGISYDFNTFNNAKLFGRLTKLQENITIDVGHNLLAAEAIKKHFEGKKVILIYNSFKDKDYSSILQTLHDVIQRVEIIEIDDTRAVERKLLERALQEAELEYAPFHSIDKDENYLVFGSFSVVEAFLKYSGVVV